MQSAPKVLIVEDDKGLADGLRNALEAEGYDVKTAASVDDGLAEGIQSNFDVVVTDLHLPGITGVEPMGGIRLLSRLHATKPHLPIILMTAFSTADSAIEAVKLGAYDYVTKPLEMPSFSQLLRKAVAASRLMTDQIELGSTAWTKDALIGKSQKMLKVYKEIGRVADKPVPVLIRGERGSGKKIIARAIYQFSNRASQPFVIVNCATIESQLESELFGHEPRKFPRQMVDRINTAEELRERFTDHQFHFHSDDVSVQRIGRLEQVNNGTILLDNLGELGASTQGKLVRLLEEKKIQRLGGDRLIPVDVRVIASMHDDLEAAVRKKQFRADLFDLLNENVIDAPALREHREDIPELVSYFLHRHKTELSCETPQISREAMESLKEYSWPGNVREMEKVIRRVLLRARGSVISAEFVHDTIPDFLQTSERVLEQSPTDTRLLPLESSLVALQHQLEVAEFQRRHRVVFLTLVFTDIVGSTQLKQDLGDHEGVSLIQRHHSIVRGILNQFPDSEEISTAGDSFFIVFSNPSDAVTFSLLLQSKLCSLSKTTLRPIQNRIGIHVGEVIVEINSGKPKAKDLYGIQVDICARVMSLGRGGQILMTRSTFDNARQVLKGRNIPGLTDIVWKSHGAYSMKGIEDPVEICEVGEAGIAPLEKPSDSAKVRRSAMTDVK